MNKILVDGGGGSGIYSNHLPLLISSCSCLFSSICAFVPCGVSFRLFSEGLEKMEREKSRQEEREKEIQTREQQLLLKKQVEKEAMADLEAIKQKRLLVRTTVFSLKLLLLMAFVFILGRK